MFEEQVPSPPRTRVPDLLVEQLLLGELPPDKAARVRAELEAEPHGLERVEQLRQSNADLLFQFPPRAMVHAIERRAGLKRNRRSALFVLVPTLAAGAAAIGLTMRGGSHPNGHPGEVTHEEIILSKGSPTLNIYRKGSDSAHRLAPNSVVHPHDLLQLSYLATDAHYGVIFSIDGRGGVTLHFPEQASDPQTLDGKQEISLNNSYELDNSPGFERFFFVASDSPIDIPAVLNQARQLASHPARAAESNLDLPARTHQYSIVLRKEP